MIYIFFCEDQLLLETKPAPLNYCTKYQLILLKSLVLPNVSATNCKFCWLLPIDLWLTEVRLAIIPILESFNTRHYLVIIIYCWTSPSGQEVRCRATDLMSASWALEGGLVSDVGRPGSCYITLWGCQYYVWSSWYCIVKSWPRPCWQWPGL